MSRSSARRASATSKSSRCGQRAVRGGVRLLAVGRRVDVRPAGEDQAVEHVEPLVGRLLGLRVGREHQRQAAGGLDRVDVGAVEQVRLLVPDGPAGLLEGGADADAGRRSATGSA